MPDLYNEADQQPPRTGLVLLQALILGLFCLFAVRLCISRFTGARSTPSRPGRTSSGRNPSSRRAA